MVEESEKVDHQKLSEHVPPHNRGFQVIVGSRKQTEHPNSAQVTKKSVNLRRPSRSESDRTSKKARKLIEELPVDHNKGARCSNVTPQVFK
jgi:hypothetical protein